MPYKVGLIESLFFLCDILHKSFPKRPYQILIRASLDKNKETFIFLM